MLAKCSICHKEFQTVEDFENYNCPIDAEVHKNNDVLDQFESQGLQYTFAVIGPRESGKSYYIYSLIHLLYDQPNPIVREYMDKLDMWVDFVGERSRKQYERFKARLLTTMLDGTTTVDPENNIPIVLSIKIGQYPRHKTIKLTFFDISGEHFESRSFMEQEPRIHKAKGVIFLFDPYRDTKLNLLVPNPVDAPSENFNILGNLFQAISKNARRRLVKVAIPVAFCISMFDLLEAEIPHLIAQRPYLEVDQLINNRNKLNSRLCHSKSAELKKFLTSESQISLRKIEAKFFNHALFAISAIGHDDLENIGFKGIDSKGILAPLFWLLAQCGILDKT